ncbi:MAG TPA: AMP-binding protein [Acidimicrobiales bacterium]|nr:AMP-binding protein [Acidimicrobiales bacterium]
MTGEVSFARGVRRLATTCPDEPVVRHVGEDGREVVLTGAELDRRSDQLAAALAALGLGVGDRLGLGMRNSPAFVLAALAGWKLGAVPVPQRWDLPAWERERVLAVIEPRIQLDAEDVAWIDATADLAVPDLPDVVSPQVSGICSSGSTGTPKVILSERPAVVDATLGAPFMEGWRPVARPQTILVPGPMYHANGFATLFSLVTGDRLVVLERFDAARAVEAIERHRVTTFTATPTMLQRIADLPGVDHHDLSSVDWILQGAALMPPSLVHRWADLIGAERIVMVYGMTEGLGFTALRGDEWMDHPGSVGRGVRGTEVRVLGPEGDDLPPGEIGEVYLRSPMSAGFRYLGDAAPRDTTDDGFATVGDLGFLAADGYLHLVDRRVDLIVSGGANVYPAEVETALVDHPAIADIVVIGLRDPEWGRRVHAIVEPVDPGAPPDATDIVTYAKGRLAPYKVPKTVEIVDAIPRSEATKVNRRALVEARGG